MKSVRAVKIVSTEGGADYDNVSVTLKGDCGFSAKIKFRTSDTASLALELGRKYTLALTEVPEVQTAHDAD